MPGIGLGLGIGIGSGGGGGGVSARAATISSTATGVIYTLSRLLGSSSTLALIGGTNGNLTLNAATGALSAATALGSASQTAVVREFLGQRAVEYPVVITGSVTPTLTLGGPLTFTISTAAGTLVATIGNVPADVTPTLTPNDGRLTIAGDQATGWKVVVGLTASSAGSIALTVSAAGTNPASSTVTVTSGADVTPPAITSSASGTVAENSAFSLTLTADEAVTWTKTGGADAARFTLTGNTLAMAAQDFDAPIDADANNVYLVQVTATDAAGNATVQNIAVTVSNLNDTTASAFAFTAASNVTAGSTQTSDTITVAGLGASDSASAAVSGAVSSMVSKNGGAFVVGPVTVVNGDTLAVRHTASGSASTATSTTLTVGTTSAAFTSTTAAAASAKFGSTSATWGDPALTFGMTA